MRTIMNESDDRGARAMGSINENDISLPVLVLYSSNTVFVIKRTDEDEGWARNGRTGRKGVGLAQARSPYLPAY